MPAARAPRAESLRIVHGRAAREGIDHMRRTPLATVVGVAVMAIALGLPAMLDALLENQRTLARTWGGEPSLTVFVRPGVALDDARALSQRLASDPDVARIEFVDASAALVEFGAASGIPVTLNTDGADLPHILVVTPRATAWSGGRADALVDRLEAVPMVDQVIVDFAWVERLAAFGTLARRGVWLFGFLLGGATLLIVGNTIRVLVEQQRPTIEVQKLIGATDAFVRRPFLYSGALQGLAAGLLALVLVEAALAALGPPVARLAAAYGSTFELQALSPAHGLVLVVVATALGWCGAWLGIGLSLQRLAPGRSD